MPNTGTIRDDCRLLSGEQQAKWEMITIKWLKRKIGKPQNRPKETSQLKLIFCKTVFSWGKKRCQ